MRATPAQLCSPRLIPLLATILAESVEFSAPGSGFAQLPEGHGIRFEPVDQWLQDVTCAWEVGAVDVTVRLTKRFRGVEYRCSRRISRLELRHARFPRGIIATHIEWCLDDIYQSICNPEAGK